MSALYALQTDIAAMEPALVLTVGPGASLQCAGTLDERTCHHLVEVVRHVLGSAPGAVTIDVERLQLADADAADALTQVQRMVKDAGATLHWHGIRADHLQKAPTLDYQAAARSSSRPRGASFATWSPGTSTAA